MDDPGLFDFLFGLGPVSGIGQEECLFTGEEKGPVAACKTAEVADILKIGKENSIELIEIDDFPNRPLPFVKKRVLHHPFFLSRI